MTRLSFRRKPTPETMTSQFPKIGAFCRVRIFALFGSVRVKGLGQRWKRIRGLRGRLEPIQIQHPGDGAGSLTMRSVPIRDVSTGGSGVPARTVVRNCPGDTHPGALWMHPRARFRKLKNGSGCGKILDSIVSTRPGLNTPDVSRCSRAPKGKLRRPSQDSPPFPKHD